MGCTAAESVRECTSTIIYVHFLETVGVKFRPAALAGANAPETSAFHPRSRFRQGYTPTNLTRKDGTCQAVAVHPNFEEPSFRVLSPGRPPPKAQAGPQVLHIVQSCSRATFRLL